MKWESNLVPHEWLEIKFNCISFQLEEAEEQKAAKKKEEFDKRIDTDKV